MIVVGAEANPVVYIGSSLAGKSTAAQCLANALGGCIYEVKNESGRTLYEVNVIFARSTPSGEKPLLLALPLITHPGHDLEESISQGHSHRTKKSYPTEMPYAAPILVIDSGKDIYAQLERTIAPLMREWGITRARESLSTRGQNYSVGALVSHANERPSWWSAPYDNRLKELGANQLFYADNKTSEPNIPDLQNGTVESLVVPLRENYGNPDIQLIYFAGKTREIPERLQPYVLHMADTPFLLRPAEEQDRMALKQSFERINLTPTESLKW